MACSLSVWRQWVAHTKLRDALQLYEFQFMKYKCGDGSNNDANTKELEMTFWMGDAGRVLQ